MEKDDDFIKLCLALMCLAISLFAWALFAI